MKARTSMSRSSTEPEELMTHLPSFRGAETLTNIPIEGSYFDWNGILRDGFKRNTSQFVWLKNTPNTTSVNYPDNWLRDEGYNRFNLGNHTYVYPRKA